MANTALRLHRYGGVDAVRIDTIADPAPGPGQVVVEVAAAGINPLDWKMREGLMSETMPLALPAVLGLELAGRIVDTNGHADLREGDRVMGAIGGVGAYARSVAVDARNLGYTPVFLDDDTAAGIPVAIQTAHQLVADLGDIDHRRVLIQGASGAVGGYAVQMALQAGAEVLATASPSGIDRVRSLGAALVLDYGGEPFEQRIDNVDAVIDLVGGETLDRSWRVVRPGGTIVSTVAPDIAEHAPADRCGRFLNMRCDGAELARLAGYVADGRLTPPPLQICAFDALPDAIERAGRGSSTGKTIVRIQAN